MTPEGKSPVRSLQKLMGAVAAVLRLGFNSSKCKTEAKMATARIKLLRNKREAVVRQMRRDVAALLRSRQDDTARIRVEHVIREQNVMAANEIIDLFCELLVARLPIIAKQRDCPADLKEGISSLIYAAPRCSEIPELSRIRDIFEKKYGKDFVSAATDLRPNSGVNRLLIEKLSVKKPTGEVKLKIMKEIAKEHHVEWDATETEMELLKPPEELMEGPRSFVSASSIPVTPILPPRDVQSKVPNFRYDNDRGGAAIQFKDTASAAQAAAQSAEKAVSAAQAAAYLAKQNYHAFDQTTTLETTVYSVNQLNKTDGPCRESFDPSTHSLTNGSSGNEYKPSGKNFSSQSFSGSNYMNATDMDFPNLDDQKIARRNSYAGRRVHSDINFDDSDGLDSDCDEEMEMETPPESRLPPNRPPPVLPHRDHDEEKSTPGSYSDKSKVNVGSRVHPKLPDYEELAARFEALKQRKS